MLRDELKTSQSHRGNVEIWHQHLARTNLIEEGC